MMTSGPIFSFFISFFRGRPGRNRRNYPPHHYHREAVRQVVGGAGAMRTTQKFIWIWIRPNFKHEDKWNGFFKFLGKKMMKLTYTWDLSGHKNIIKNMVAIRSFIRYFVQKAYVKMSKLC